MLASVWNFLTVPPSGYMAEQKIDGWRAVYRRDWRGKPGLFTRNGQLIEGVGHILHRIAIMEAIAGERLVIDGEFQVGGTLDATKRWCERGWKQGGDAGTLFAFDVLTEEEWRAGGSDTPLFQRKARLVQLVAEADAHPLMWEWRPGTRGKEPDCPALEVLADEWCADAAAVLDLARRTWAAGGEGIMLKDAEAPYERKRSNRWMKVKHPDYAPGKGVVPRAAAA
jgi:ATP-dependent DNA ligase